MDFFGKYLQQHSLEIYDKIKTKKVIYLDTKYWILLRDQEKIKDTTQKQLVERFTELLNSNKCVFPISRTIFWEIMKQTDNIRKGSFEIIDKFSNGVGIIDDIDRIKIEFYYWIRSLSGADGLIEPQKLIWSNIHLVVGKKFYSEKAKLLSKGLQKELVNFTAELSISKAFDIADTIIPPFKYKDNVEEFNANKEKYKDENKTFDEMFLSELAGMLDVYQDDFNEVMIDEYIEKKDKHPTEDELKDFDAKTWCKIIYNSFKLGKIDTGLPYLKIFPSLFGLMRWNKERQYRDGNDSMDVMHATAALPYCDYFFTEKELRAMISQLKLDKSFNCVTESSPVEILSALEVI